MNKARVLLKPSLLTTCLTRATTFFSSVSQLRSFSHQIEMDPSNSERYCYDPVLRWNPQVEEYFTKAYGPDHFARISKALTYFSIILIYLSIRFALQLIQSQILLLRQCLLHFALLSIFRICFILGGHLHTRAFG